MRLKTFIITGLTGLLCSCTHAQQAQYWKETPYDLENEKSNNQTFFSEFGRFLIAHLEPGIPEYGEVTMHFIIDREGKAKNVEIKGEEGYGTIMAMNNLPLFKPAALNGREVGVRLTLTVRFNSYF